MSKANELTVESVSQYIKMLNEIIDNDDSDDKIYLFRGESKIYPTSAQPNLFRTTHIRENPFYEKNLFDEIKANKLTQAESYLEIAIDAQHGGFPSRLLDVSYNSLVALFFATTPSKKDKIDSSDGVDGVVYMFVMDKLFCPTSDNTIINYNTQINRDQDWYYNSSIFQKNYKLVDHIKANSRIIAQQGAFIMFPGDECSEISKDKYHKLIIKGKAKKSIRQELKNLFGIYMGSIYPEAENTVDELNRKSSFIDNSQFNFENEINLIQLKIIDMIAYYAREILRNDNNDRIKLIIEFEEKLYDFKIGIEELNANLDSPEKELVVSLIQCYNNQLEEFYMFIDTMFENNKTSFDLENLFSEIDLKI